MGGQLKSPFTQPLEVQAASFLTNVGGYGSARVENFRFKEIVSFKAGYSQVIGIEREQGGTTIRETLASAVVEGLNILDMVTADRVVARLTSETPSTATPTDELRILPFGSYFENLRIAGQLIEITPHPHLLDKAAATKTGLQNTSAGLLFDPDASAPTNFIVLPVTSTLRCSLFKSPKVAGTTALIPGATTGPGWRIEIPSFGAIYLGEYVVTGGHRQLTMLRVELHSPEEGRIVFATVEGNGSAY
jgi:hypothetical protein